MTEVQIGFSDEDPEDERPRARAVPADRALLVGATAVIGWTDCARAQSAIHGPTVHGAPR